MSLSALRATSESISSEKQRANDRKKGILVLINQFLIENGYLDSAERLQSETSNIAGKYDLCDNIDLALILNEYEAYYEMRFDKKPKILKKSANDGSESSIARGSGRSAAGSSLLPHRMIYLLN
jgi:katanin p60 ATPase-containing subunit A1